MKKFAVVLALASSSAFAQDLMLGDLNFFQKAGSWYYNTDLAYARGESEVDNAGAKDEYRTGSIVWNNAVTYGISDKLNVGLGVDWALRNATSHEKASVGGKDKKTSSDGLGDFSVLGNYRLKSDDVYVDLVGGLTLGFTDAETAVGTAAGESEGNTNQGHHSLDLAVAAGQKMSNNMEWRASLGVDYHLSGEGSQVTKGAADADYDSDSYMNWVASVAGQYRMNNTWAFAANLDYVIPGDQTLEFDAPTGDVDVETDNVWNLGLVAKHNFSSNALVSLGYSLTSGYEQDEKNGGATTTEDFDMGHTITLGGQFLF